MGVTPRLGLDFQMEFPVINIALVQKRNGDLVPAVHILHHLHWLSNVLFPFL